MDPDVFHKYGAYKVNLHIFFFFINNVIVCMELNPLQFYWTILPLILSEPALL